MAKFRCGKCEELYLYPISYDQEWFNYLLKKGWKHRQLDEDGSGDMICPKCAKKQKKHPIREGKIQQNNLNQFI